MRHERVADAHVRLLVRLLVAQLKVLPALDRVHLLELRSGRLFARRVVGVQGTLHTDDQRDLERVARDAALREAAQALPMLG